MIRLVASPARAALLVFLVLLLPYLGGTPASARAQTIPTVASSKINFPLPTYRAWQDQSGSLPGTSSTTTVVVIAGVVVVTAAVAFLVIRHNKHATKTKGAPQDSTTVSAAVSVPSGSATSTSARDPSGLHLPKLFIGVDPSSGVSGARWRMGLSWAF